MGGPGDEERSRTILYQAGANGGDCCCIRESLKEPTKSPEAACGQGERKTRIGRSVCRRECSHSEGGGRGGKSLWQPLSGADCGRDRLRKGHPGAVAPRS